MRIKIGLVSTAILLAACSGGSDVEQTVPGSLPPEAQTPGAPAAQDPSASSSGDPQQPGGETPKPPEKAAPLAKGITVSEVAVFQAVKISVAKAGAKVTQRSAQVVAGRDALIRAYVTPDQGAGSKPLTAELRISSNGTEQVFKDTKTISAASTDAALTSTFNFEVPGTALVTGATYSVAITDPSLPGTRGGETSAARYPADGGLEALEVKSTGKQLRVQLVPLRYDADGSGRLPDTSPAQIERYRQGFMKNYPVAAVEITVHAPVAWSSSISANGSGFSSALQSLVSLRQRDGAAPDLYYMGIFAPAASFAQYCSGGCVTGLSGLISDPRDSAGRASVGVGFTGDQSVSTAVHEVGHAHGRSHSPCGGASDADPRFPYANGSIGSWGYDIVAKKLLAPAQYKDFMGYCQPEWVSDYTYNALFKRVQSVNGVPTVSLKVGEPQTYRIVSIEPDGRLAWGDTVSMREPPRNEPRTVKYVGADGATLETVTGFYYPYDDLEGGYMLVPEATKTFDRMQIVGLPSRFDSVLRFAR